MGMDLSAFREEYLKDTLHRSDLAATPFEQFDRWFKQALESGIPEPNAMSIATATPQGMPSLRTVLLKYYDARGYVFFTNYTSRKAREIEANPEMCMMLPWVTLERQIIVYGRAEKISRAETLKYFLSRPHESQLGAWVSHQSQVISTRKLLMMKLAELKNKFAEGKVPLPDFWEATALCRTTWSSGRAAPAACTTASCTPCSRMAPGPSNASNPDRMISD